MKTLKTIALSSILLTVTACAFAEFDNTNILVEQAVNHIYQQRYKQAHSILKEAYEQSPRHPGVHFNLGRLFELTGNFQEALKEYRLAASLDQSMVAARRGIARCSVELKKAAVTTPAQNAGPSNKSNGYAAPVVTQKTPAKQQNQYVIPENPFPTQPNYSGYDSPTAPQKAKSSAPVITQNNYSQGKDALQTSKVYSSTNNLDLPPLPQSVTIKVSKPSGESKARTMLDNGDTDGAIKALEAILEKNPDSPEAHYLMGKALGLKNNLFGAIKHLEEAVRVNEKYYDAYYLLGKDYAKVNLMEDAIKNYLIYYGVKPQASVAVEIAKTYENMGKQAQANDFYSTVQDNNGNLWKILVAQHSLYQSF